MSQGGGDRCHSMVPALYARPTRTAVGTHLAPEPLWASAMGMASEKLDRLLRVWDQAVIQIIMDSIVPFTRALYANRWKIFSEWCRVHKEIPESSSVPIILHCWQSLLEKKLSVSTLRVYVAAISASHIRVGNQTMGSHTLVTLFLKGAQQLSRFPNGTCLWCWKPFACPPLSLWRSQAKVVFSQGCFSSGNGITEASEWASCLISE